MVTDNFNEIPLTYCEAKILNILLAQSSDYDLVFQDIANRINAEYNVSLTGEELEDEFKFIDKDNLMVRGDSESYLLRYPEALLVHNIRDRRKVLRSITDRIEATQGTRLKVKQIEKDFRLDKPGRRLIKL